MTSPRILVIGAGAMGSRHVRVVAQSTGATLAGVVDPRRDFGQAVAERYGTAWFPELPDLRNVDGVIVAAATEAHVGLVADCLATGKPVLVEKPVAVGFQQTLELVAAAEAADVPLMCGLLERFNPAVLTARAFIEQPVHVMAVRHSPYAPRIATGVAWDLLVHDVDLAVSLIGTDPITINGALGRFDPRSAVDAEDVAEATLTFSSGAVAHASASRIGQRKVRSLSIYEVDKLIELDLLRRDVTLYRNVSDQAADDDGRGYRFETVIEIPEIVSSREPLAAQFDHFLDLVSGLADAGSERASILPSHRIIDAIKSN